jgi:hypothetical protein
MQQKINDHLYVNKPKGIKSQYHNLTTQESYNSVPITLEQQETITCDVFEKYGEEGHMLVYSRNSKKNNLPYFVYHFINQYLLQHAEIAPIIMENLNDYNKKYVSEHSDHKVADWNFTLNFYEKPSEGKTYSGFPFHTDIASNGNMTVILTLESSALIEFKRAVVPHDGFHPKKDAQTQQQEVQEDDIKPVLLEPKSLVLITGESRWNYVHRIASNNAFEYEGKVYQREPRVSYVHGLVPT